MRIVSLVPSATEMLFALGLGDDLVGVTHGATIPDTRWSCAGSLVTACPTV